MGIACLTHRVYGGNDLTINALGGVSGGYAGIKAQNEGTGLTLINTAGEINSGFTGIDVQNDSRATGLTVRSSSDIQAGMVGIKAINWGSGATDIFSAGAIESDDDGIYLDHRGADLRLVAQGSITSEQANGISVVSYAQSDARLSITATSQVYGEEDGIFVIGGGNDGVVNITASDSVTGQNGTGIYIYSNLLDATVDIASTVKGGNGTAIDMENAGKSATLVLRHGWALEGQAIATQEGNDTLRLAGLANGSLSLAQIGNDADANAIMGFERVEKVDSSIWTLTGNQQFGGFESAALSGGGLVLDNASFLLAGAASTFDIERGTTLYVKGASSIDGALSSRGTIDLNTTGTPDNTLTVTGDFTSSDSLLRFGTQLGADGSPTSLLVVEGNTFGQGRVQVDNLGGLGAQTIEGIKLIHVEQDSNATFEKNSRIVAGSYDYDLVKKGGNWYLTSVYQEPTPETEIEPKPEEGKHVYRPEAGSYLANYMASNTLFITRLHDRLGETQYTDVLTGEKKVTSLWMRHVGGHNRFRDGSGQLHTQSNRYVLQLGGDLAQWSTSGLDRWHLGAMAGYANQRSNTEAKYSKYRSRGSVEGYSAGLYGTWYANDREKTGSYVDAWALYNWFDSDVKGEELKSESYSSRGVTASVEGGYTIKLGERLSDGVVYYLQPKAQVVWMNVRTKDHTESNGTRIAFRGDGNIQTRLGLRAYMNGRADSDKNTDRKFQPFVEANWLHNTNDFSLRMDDVNNRVAGAKNLAELKLGVEGQISKELDIWTNVAQQLGDQGYSDTQAMMGIKYRF